MEGVLILGLAGIAGTLVAPLVAGRVQRTALKEDRIHHRGLDAYVDLLETARHLRDNAQTWSAIPVADLQEPPIERLRGIDARIRAFGSDQVLAKMQRVAQLVARYSRQLDLARLRHKRDEREGQVDSSEAMAVRLGLGEIADEITAAVDELEASIREETKL